MKVSVEDNKSIYFDSSLTQSGLILGSREEKGSRYKFSILR